MLLTADAIREYRDRIEVGAKRLQEAFKEMLRKQGHRNVGNLEQSLVYEIKTEDTAIVLEYWVEDYGVILDRGVPKERIPFKFGSGDANSKYIDGLFDYFLSKGLTGFDLSGAVWGTAWVQRYRDGMPTTGSRKFSENGRRTGWINDTVDEKYVDIERLFENGADSMFDIIAEKMVAGVAF